MRVAGRNPEAARVQARMPSESRARTDPQLPLRRAQFGPLHLLASSKPVGL